MMIVVIQIVKMKEKEEKVNLKENLNLRKKRAKMIKIIKIGKKEIIIILMMIVIVMKLLILRMVRKNQRRRKK